MTDWKTLADKETINKTIESLKANNINAMLVESGEEAKKKVLEMLPNGAEVMNMSSVTIDSIGLDKEIVESGKFNSVKKTLAAMDRKTQGREMQKLGTAPDYAVGSVHAVTLDGKVLIASNTGSQLPAYVYGSDHVIWVVGAQKIVKTLDEAWERLYEHTLPLESERLKKIYNVPSFVSKVLIVNREVKPGRISMVIVNEV